MRRSECYTSITLICHHFLLQMRDVHKWNSHLYTPPGLCSTLSNMSYTTLRLYKNGASVYICSCGSSGIVYKPECYTSNFLHWPHACIPLQFFFKPVLMPLKSLSQYIHLFKWDQMIHSLLQAFQLMSMLLVFAKRNKTVAWRSKRAG